MEEKEEREQREKKVGLSFGFSCSGWAKRRERVNERLYIVETSYFGLAAIVWPPIGTNCSLCASHTKSGLLCALP